MVQEIHDWLDGAANLLVRRILIFKFRAQLAAAAFVTLSTIAATGGIPEPDLVWYGKVLASSGGTTVRLTAGTLAWRIERVTGGPAIVIATALTNINDQFSYVLRVPCETPEPGVTPSTNVVNLTVPPIAYRRMTVTLDGEPLSLIDATNQFSALPTLRGRTERIDLRLGPAPVDSDGDGLADAWEMQHFGSLSATPGADPDGDGMSNLREFRAGTNPTDPQSLFELVEISKAPNGMSVRWSSQPERTYRVRRSSSLLTAIAQYDVVGSGLAATPPINEFIDTNPGAGPAFYIIEVEE